MTNNVSIAKIFSDCHQCPLNALAPFLGDSSHEPVHCPGEEHRRLDALMFDSGVHSERICQMVIVCDLSFKISYKAWVMLTNCWILWCRRIFQSDGRCWLSKIFSTSTNTAHKELFHSCDWSMICWSTRKWSMLGVPSMKPACSWSSSFFTAVVMRWRMMRQKTLLVMDSSVMPLQLLHTD